MTPKSMYEKQYGDPRSIEALSKAVIHLMDNVYALNKRVIVLEEAKKRQLILKRINRKFDLCERDIARLIHKMDKIERDYRETNKRLHEVKTRDEI